MPDDYTTPDRWPWPGDSKLGQIQRIALSYRALLESLIFGVVVDPAQAFREEDAQWIRLGHYWVKPSNRSPQSDWLTARDAAHFISQWYPCTERDIYKWAQRDHIKQRTEADGSLTYSWESIVAYDQKRTRQRAG